MKAATSPKALEIIEDFTEDKAEELDTIFNTLRSKKIKNKEITIGGTTYNVRIARSKKVFHK